MKVAGVGLILQILVIIMSLQAVALDTLRMSRDQCEAVFLRENLLMMAGKLEISQAEAMVLQARLWPNPYFSVEQVNFWATDAQTGGAEAIPPISGNWGQNQQFAFELEQLILTAGKRKKLIGLEEVNAEISRQYFDDLLRNLKIEFRNQLTNLQHIQFRRSLYENQLRSIVQLASAYRRQVDQGNVPKGQYLRLKALELETARQINQLNLEANEAQKDLKLLMRIPPETVLIISDEGFLRDTGQIRQFSPGELIDKAAESRPDLKIAQLEEGYYRQLHAYERAQRTPNLTLKSGYDRGGNAMLNFVGFGIGVDLPVFNRNQGSIRQASIGIEHAGIMRLQAALSVENEIVMAYRNLLDVAGFYESIEPDYEATLDQMLESYTANFTNRNISLLEYLDFQEAYMDNKEIILEAGRNVNERIEELNYLLGTDLLR